jgi:DNA-binding CsgD family transcriptional regulator
MTRATSNSRQPLDGLSDSQLEILELLGMGNDPAQIARKLKLAEKAVTSELKLMRSKLGLSSENELIRQAVCWVEAGEE